MGDPGVSDILSKAPPKEMPRAQAASPAVKEKATGTKKDTQPSGGARKKLEDIAAGKPVAEALAPAVEASPLPDREMVSGLLTEANSMLLDAKDSRILITALATQAADTPMGNEMRVDTLRMMAKMSNENLPPETVIQLDALQKKITTLKLPESNPEQSQLVQTIQNYNQTHPDKAVPQEVVDQIKSGQAEGAPTVAKLLQGNPELAGQVWKGLTGLDNFTGFDLTPQRVLALTEMDATPENQKKMSAIFGAIKAGKQPIDLMSKVVPGLMLGALGIMFVTQIAGVDQQSGGH